MMFVCVDITKTIIRSKKQFATINRSFSGQGLKAGSCHSSIYFLNVTCIKIFKSLTFPALLFIPWESFGELSDFCCKFHEGMRKKI